MHPLVPFFFSFTHSHLFTVPVGLRIYTPRTTPALTPFHGCIGLSPLFSLPLLPRIRRAIPRARKLERVGNNGRKKRYGKREHFCLDLPSHLLVTSLPLPPRIEGPSRPPPPTTTPAHSALHVFGAENASGRSELSYRIYTEARLVRRKGSKEGRARGGESDEDRGERGGKREK